MTTENQPEPPENTAPPPPAAETPAAAPPPPPPYAPVAQHTHEGYTVSRRNAWTAGAVVAGVVLFAFGFALGSWQDGDDDHRGHRYEGPRAMQSRPDFGGRSGPQGPQRFFDQQQRRRGNQDGQQPPQNRQPDFRPQAPNSPPGVTPRPAATPPANQ